MPNYSESFFVGKEEVLEILHKMNGVASKNFEDEEIVEEFEIFRASISPKMEEFLECISDGNEAKSMQIKIELFSSILQNLRNSLCK